MRKIVAVGDIHADHKKLIDVMNQLEERIDFAETPVVFLGDVVDGGLEANACLDQLMQYQSDFPHWVFLLGNHEDLMLNALRYQVSKCQPMIPKNDYTLWYSQGGRETLASYWENSSFTAYEKAIAQPIDLIPVEHLRFLASLPLMHESNRFYFAHAGFKPHRLPHDQTEFDLLWIRNEFLNSDYAWGKRVVAGHTHHFAPLVAPNKIVIDTMHHGHGVLTAVILDDETGEICEFVQSFAT